MGAHQGQKARMLGGGAAAVLIWVNGTFAVMARTKGLSP
jgi:hypothetical protein